MPEIVYKLEGKKTTFPLEKGEITIGRHRSNDIVINSPYISRRHARLYRQGEAWRVVDLGSTCGTRINQLQHTDKDLHHGDRIFLHELALTFVDLSEAGADGASDSVTDERELDSEVSVMLTPASAQPSLAPQTVYKSAVDFTELASTSADARHLQRLLRIATKASEVTRVSSSIEQTFEAVLELVFDHLPVQRGFIMLWDEDKHDLVTTCVKLDRETPQDATEILFSRTIAEKVYQDRVAVLTTDAQIDERFAAGKSIAALGIRSAMAAPVWHEDKVDGLIYADTTVRTKAFDKHDIDLLSALGNQLAVAIEQSRLQDSILEQQVVRQRLERYHAPAVVERITREQEDAHDVLMAEECDVTIVFADVVGFTKRCMGMEPRKIADLLNRYFSEMADMIFRHDGTLDKFIGDCVMAVFGAPLPMEDHARCAVEAALDMREALNRLNEPLPEQERLQFRVGVHSGRVVAGDIGSVRRRDYTVLGSSVNLASRLESAAEPGQILVSEATRDLLGEGYETRFAGEHQPKGFDRKVRCYELVGRVSTG